MAVFFEGQNLKSVPAHSIVGLGIAHVPEGRGVFGNLTVKENLQLATWQRKINQKLMQTMIVYSLFSLS